ncbi:MAG: hypothetical protein NTV49_03210 [Kiritimatiellaeota bacterium]|nr:hypothetical protein [Kiritimatiellota bacterium]
MTVKTKPVARATLDDWPLAEAGLSFRATRAIRASGLRTVGQLRDCPDAKLLELWSFGRKTLVEVHAFFGFCERLEQGQQTFRSLREVFELFLPANQREILYARFQMEAAASHPPRRRATLQHIGTAYWHGPEADP